MFGTIDRRNLLKAGSTMLMASSAVCNRASARTTFSIALGSGAARGLAHIPVLEALDELGVVPSAISGTSMGAIVGALYASGMKGSDIRAYALDMLSSRLNTLRQLFPGDFGSWASIFAFDNSGALEAEKLMSVVLSDRVPQTFDELTIPLRIVTTDFYREEEFVIDSGPLHKAIGASAALPVFLSPVQWGDLVLIDGSFVNPTPFDTLSDQPGIIVAVDVTGSGYRTTGRLPAALDIWIGSAQIALHSLVNERLRRIQPDLLIRPEVGAFATTEFHRIDEILAVAENAKEQAKMELGDLLDSAR